MRETHLCGKCLGSFQSNITRPTWHLAELLLADIHYGLHRHYDSITCENRYHSKHLNVSRILS
jgi:hypothetical protein